MVLHKSRFGEKSAHKPLLEVMFDSRHDWTGSNQANHGPEFFYLAVSSTRAVFIVSDLMSKLRLKDDWKALQSRGLVKCKCGVARECALTPSLLGHNPTREMSYNASLF